MTISINYDMFDFMHYVSYYPNQYIDKYGEENYDAIVASVENMEQILSYSSSIGANEMPVADDLVENVYKALKDVLNSEEQLLVACMCVINIFNDNTNIDQILENDSYFNELTQLVIDTKEAVGGYFKPDLE
jgi:hypothetical protein